MDIGSKLREKRHDLGLSVEDISARTLINIKYIHSIEENKFSDIPAQAMTFGFLRNYSVILGLNPDEIISEYLRSNPVRHDGYLKINKIKIKDAPPVKTIPNYFGIKIVPVIVSVVVVAFIFGVIKIISITIKSDNAVSAISVQQTIKKNHLEIQTTDNVWLQIKEGENPIFEGIIPPNTIKTYESAEQFSLRIGNLSGITVSINGIPVELPKGKLVGEIKLP